jgi:hypothetical protein
VNDLPTLQTALLDLLYETRDTDLRLIVGSSQPPHGGECVWGDTTLAAPAGQTR